MSENCLGIFTKSFFFQFKAIPDTPQGALHSERDRYKPDISDVSDSELVEATESVVKALTNGWKNSFPILKLVPA